MALHLAPGKDLGKYKESWINWELPERVLVHPSIGMQHNSVHKRTLDYNFTTHMLCVINSICWKEDCKIFHSDAQENQG